MADDFKIKPNVYNWWDLFHENMLVDSFQTERETEERMHSMIEYAQGIRPVVAGGNGASVGFA